MKGCILPGAFLKSASTFKYPFYVFQRAAIAAKSRGMKVFGLLGRDGGSLKQHCDIYLIAPGDTADRIQEIHIKVLHILIEQVERLMFPKNY